MTSRTRSATWHGFCLVFQRNGKWYFIVKCECALGTVCVCLLLLINKNDTAGYFWAATLSWEPPKPSNNPSVSNSTLKFAQNHIQTELVGLPQARCIPEQTVNEPQQSSAHPGVGRHKSKCLMLSSRGDHGGNLWGPKYLHHK